MCIYIYPTLSNTKLNKNGLIGLIDPEHLRVRTNEAELSCSMAWRGPSPKIRPEPHPGVAPWSIWSIWSIWWWNNHRSWRICHPWGCYGSQIQIHSADASAQFEMYRPVNKRSYWNWSFLVDLPIDNGDFPVRYVNVYQFAYGFLQNKAMRSQLCASYHRAMLRQIRETRLHPIGRVGWWVAVVCAGEALQREPLEARSLFTLIWSNLGREKVGSSAWAERCFQNRDGYWWYHIDCWLKKTAWGGFQGDTGLVRLGWFYAAMVDHGKVAPPRMDLA